MSDSLTLWNGLYDAGWQSCSTLDSTLKAIHNLSVHEEAVARSLGMMIRTQSSFEHGQGWNVSHFVKAVNIKNEHLEWELVIKYLDCPDFAVCDGAGLKLLLDAWASAEQNKTFPVYLLFQPWGNARGQLSILYHMVYSNSDLLLTVMQILSSTTTKVIQDRDIQSLPISVRTEATQLATQPLNSLEFMKTFLHLFDTMVADDIRILMDRLSIQAPELLLLGLAQIQPLQNQLHRDTLLKLLNIFLIGHANSHLVIILLWKQSPALLMDGFLALYKKDPTSITRILEVSQEAKILFHVLKIDVPYFALDLASLAARRQHLNLEKWLMDGFVKDKLRFTSVCIDFLEKKYMVEATRQTGPTAVSAFQLSAEVVSIFLRFLGECVSQPFENAKLVQLVQAYSKIYPQLNEPPSSTPNPKSAADGDGDSERSYAPEVEETVRRYFERLYTTEANPSRFASLLNTCRNSSDQKQLDFFSCTVHTLLDEARFFDQYPDNELLVTGELLGLLVEHHLISYAQLRVALKYILDAANTKVGSKMFNFGIQALLQFRGRYNEWPQYTILLSKIDGLKGYPAIYDSITTALQQIGQREQEQGTPKDSTLMDKGNGKSTTNGHDLAPDVSSLLDNPGASSSHEQPSTKIQERVSFLINNLAIGNMDTKCPELLSLLNPSTWPWFSHYLVVRRVSIEPNNHDLYMSLLNELDLAQLNEIIVEDTYQNIHMLLQSDTIVSSSADRKLLKNLAIWLGKMTIAKNKPIRHKDLSFKDLLLDAYDKERLIVAIPLCCQVLHQAGASKVFKPPNPWLMSILKLLAELYWTDKLRLNMKFEIEILFDNLKLDLNEIEPTSLLAKRQIIQEAAQKLGQAQQQQQQQQQQQHMQPPPHLQPRQSPRAPLANGIAAGPPLNMLSPQRPDQEQRPPGINNNRPDVDISPLLSRLQFNPMVSQFIGQQPLVKATIFRAISESFAEVVPPVILTSSNIATVSTKELVLKDFATEPDEMKLKRAAYAMIQPLVGNLAVATCKETLCNSMVEALRDELANIGLPEPLADEVATSVVYDNLQLTCLFVEQLAHFRAIGDIDRALSMAYANRMSHKEQHGEDFYDPLGRNSAPRSTPLPAALKPKGSISAEQMFLYESFNRPAYNPLQQTPIAPPPGTMMNSAHMSPVPVNDTANVTTNLAVKLEQMLLEMDRMVRQTDVASITLLPPNHHLILLVRQVPQMISQNSAPLPAVMKFVEKVVYMLYDSHTAFQREFYVVFLQTLLTISPEVANEALAWLLYSDDHRVFNAEVIATLIQYEVIPAEEYDTQLAKLIYNKVDGAAGFAIDLVQLCLLADRPFTLLEDHALTVTALRHQSLTDTKLSTRISEFLANLEESTKPPYVETGGNEARCLDVHLLLAEWIRINQHPLVTDDICQSVVKKASLLTQDTEGLCFFVRLCTEVCVDHYMSRRSSSPTHQRRSVAMIDSYAKFVSCMASSAARSGKTRKLEVFGKALSVIVLVLARHHERLGSDFNQKPFLRLLTSLYAEIHGCMDLSLLIAFSDTLLTLQPINFPGFAFAWLHLISHRNYLPQLLVTDDNKGWAICQRLVMGLLEFLRPLLEQQQLDTATKTFYRGTLRVLVVLLHDFPEFLCHHYIVFSQAIPISSIQMRNLVLSAFPRTMHLPDPFTPNLQLDDLAESKLCPALDGSYLNVLSGTNLISTIDAYFSANDGAAKDREGLEGLLDQVLNEISGAMAKDRHCGSQTLSALVLYVGNKTSALPFSVDSLAMSIFKHLLSNLADEGCYLLLGCLADHLRYPNSHTHFFSRAILCLFENENESVKERITRVLLERLIVNRPHPWGLLSLFIDLMKDDGFWKYNFIQCSPEIEQLFSNVSRSIKHAS